MRMNEPTAVIRRSPIIFRRRLWTSDHPVVIEERTDLIHRPSASLILRGDMDLSSVAVRALLSAGAGAAPP
ncbi:MAG TPA: hypothetical protein VF517_09995 [Thermoleophilaceae bacterium]|jgi:hypothetical protein